MSTVLELKEQRSQIWGRMKQIVDDAEAENRGLTTEEDTNWTAANAEMDALDKRIERQERMERKPAVNPEQRGSGMLDLGRISQAELRATPEYASAYDRWMRCIEEPEDRSILRGGFVQSRAMGVNTPTAGGYFVPEGFERRIEQAMLAFGGMRSVANVFTTSDGADLLMPTSDDTSNTGELLAEGATVGEQDVSIGNRTLKAFMYDSKIVKVSIQLLQDSAFGIEEWLSGILAERIARILNTHFTTGVGANQPSGIVGDAVEGVAGVTGQSTTVKADDLISLEHSVGAAYRTRGARYMFADSTLQTIRKLKDGQGNYLWAAAQPAGSFPSTINGYPYTINDDIGAMAASAKSILFGLLSKYLIRDVRGFGLIRFDEKYMDKLQVGFLGFSRHDGMLLDAGTHPVKYFSNSAS